MESLAPWEQELLKPFPPAPPKPAVLFVAPRDVQCGMRIYNGFDPYMVVLDVLPGESLGALTEITFSVGERVYRESWGPGCLMPVATPSIYS